MLTRDSFPPSLTPEQLAVVEQPLDAKIFLEGPAGAGKTTTGVERLLHLMAQGVPGDAILLLVPQRTLATPYYQALRHPGVIAGGMVDVLTLGGLARRMVELFWPLVSAQAGFVYPDRPPVFLNLETAQYYMARLVRPLLEGGYFDTVVISRNRLYSQILDNLNKAALVGFPHSEISARLKASWVGEASQLRVYEDTQACASLFREYCLEHNLLDFSLLVELFRDHLWPSSLCRDYLMDIYHHMLVDNLEEDNPVTHDLLAEWLPTLDSATLIFDRQAGYRSFLGADPDTGYALKDFCLVQVEFTASFVTTPAMRSFSGKLALALNREAPLDLTVDELAAQDGYLLEDVLQYDYHRYHPEMLDWVAGRIAALVHDQGVSPGEIVVLAPFLSDALRFSLTNRLEALDVPARSHRPSRALREEPAVECLLTLTALAHPQWGIAPTRYDVAYALIQAIDGLDLVRAQLLAEIVYRPGQELLSLTSFDRIRPEMQERITYAFGERYEALRAWFQDYLERPPEPLDYFLSRLFGELLSQPGYGFHRDLDAGKTAANLVDSARNFRWVAAGELPEGIVSLGHEYVEMVREGVVSAQYLRSWQLAAEEAVLLAPAYTFLMSNRPVEVQFWLDVGGRGWFERLYQPLTHPYVLSRGWPRETLWTDAHEYEYSRENLYRLALGLARRCRGQIYLGLSELNEQGYDQQGALLKAFQRLLRESAQLS